MFKVDPWKSPLNKTSSRKETLNCQDGKKDSGAGENIGTIASFLFSPPPPKTFKSLCFVALQTREISLFDLQGPIFSG